MNYTEKEIKNIKRHAFDKGWRYGLFVGLILVIITFLQFTYLNNMTPKSDWRLTITSYKNIK